MACSDPSERRRTRSGRQTDVVKPAPVRVRGHGSGGVNVPEPMGLESVFPGTSLAVGKNQCAYMVPRDDAKLSFPKQVLLQLNVLNVTIAGSLDSVKDRRGNQLTTQKILSNEAELDARNYVDSDPRMIKSEMKSCPKPALMTNILGRHTASKAEQGEVRALVKPEDDILTTDKMGATVLHHAALTGMIDLAEALLDIEDTLKNKADKLDRNALHIAAMVGDREMVTLLADPKDVDTRDMSDKTALFHAAENGHTDIVTELIGFGAEPDAVDKIWYSPLFAAVRGKWIETVELLLELGVEVNRRSKLGSTPIHLAAWTGDPRIVRLLLENHAEPCPVDKNDLTPLMLAVSKPHMEICQILLEKYTTEDVTRADMGGDQAIHMAARRGDLKLVEELITHGADADAKNESWVTPLHYAISCKALPVVTFLLTKKKVDVNAKERISGITPLILAIIVEDDEVVDKLLERGARATQPDRDGNEPIHCAAQIGNIDMVKALMEHGADPNARRKNGAQPLHAAVRFGFIGLAKVLIDHRADVSARTEDGNQPIHAAAQCGDPGLFQMLINRGADAGARNKNLVTPLHIATSTCNVRLASLLIKDQKVDVNAVDKHKMTPMGLATMKGDGDMIALLQQYGGVIQPKEQKAVADSQPMCQDLEPHGQTPPADPMDVSPPWQTPPTPGPCDAVPPLLPTHDPRLHPVLTKADVDHMLNDLTKLLEDAGAEALTQNETIVFSQRNFAMAVIGPKGGRLSFADGSVTMSIPAGALTDTRVISCYRPVGAADGEERQPNTEWAFYASELICGPDGTKFDKPITIRYQHSLHIREDGSCDSDGVQIVTKGDNEDSWNREKSSTIRIKGRWAEVQIGHFTHVGMVKPLQEARSADILMSTGLTVDPLQEAMQLSTPVPRPTHLHIFLTRHDASEMQDLRDVRLSRPHQEINAENKVIPSINLYLDLLVEGIPVTFQFTNDSRITLLLNGIRRGFVTDISIRGTDDAAQDSMLFLEPDQTEGESKAMTSYEVKRLMHSPVAPDGLFTFGTMADFLASCRGASSGREYSPYPIQVSEPQRHPIQVSDTPLGLSLQPPPPQGPPPAATPQEQPSLGAAAPPPQRQVGNLSAEVAARLAAIGTGRGLLLNIHPHSDDTDTSSDVLDSGPPASQ